MFVLNLEPYNMVIRMDWMAAHGPITFDFRSLSMVFDQEGDRVLLQGDTAETTLRFPTDNTERSKWSIKL